MAQNEDSRVKKLIDDAQRKIKRNMSKKIGKFVMKAVVAVAHAVAPLLPFIIAIGVATYVLFQFEVEIVQAETTATQIFETLEEEDFSELVEIKGNESEGYYWGFKDDADEKIETIMEDLRDNNSAITINDIDLFKSMILAQIVTQYPDLGGKTFVTGNQNYGEGNTAVCNLVISQIGKPYLVGEESDETGFDCSGLVVWAFQEAGYDWGGERCTANRFSQIGREISKEELQPGDLICEGWDGSKYGHIVVYIGNNEVVAAEAVCSLPWNQHTSGRCQSGCSVVRRQMRDDEWNTSSNKFISLSDYLTDTSNVNKISSSKDNDVVDDDFVTQFLNAAQEITDYVRENNFAYGDAQYMPPKEDGNTRDTPDQTYGSLKVISCDRLVSWALYKCGYTDTNQKQPGGLTTSSGGSPLMEYCEEKGWLRIEDVNEVQAGDIVFSGATNSDKTVAAHTFICAGDNKRYDCGMIERIQLIKSDKADFSGYTSQPFNEPITNFVCAYRVTTGYLGSGEKTWDVDNFQGAIHLRRVTPNKNIGELEDVSTGVTTEKGTYVVASSVGLGTKEEIPENVKNKMAGKSMPDDADISYNDLAYLTIPYYDFNGEEKKGHMIVREELADEVLLIFQELYNIKYPIYKMQLIDEYDGTGEDLDWNSIEDNNTSAFCYRNAVGGNSISKHGLGQAIDINPLINPYITQVGQSSSHDVSNECNYISKDLSKWQDATERWSLEKAKEANIDVDTEIYNIFKKYGWTWGGDWNSPKDYQHFEKEDLTDVAYITTIIVEEKNESEENESEENESEESTKENTQNNSYGGGVVNNAGIRSKVYDLKYVPKDVFDKHVQDGDIQALKEFTIDEDDSNKMIVAKWSYADGVTQISEQKIQSSGTYTQKYTMPIEYLIAFYIDTQNKEFVKSLANLAMDSEFVLAIQDNVSTTKTDVLKASTTDIKRSKITYEINYNDYDPVADEYGYNIKLGSKKTYKTIIEPDVLESSTIEETATPSIELTYGDTWFVKFYKDINYSSEDLSSYSIANRVNKIETINGNVRNSDNKYVSSEKQPTIEYVDDDYRYYETTTIQTTTEVKNMTYKYNTGEMNVLGNEQKFINLYKNNQEFRTELKPEWLFKLLEEQTATTNLIDLTKYLIYLAKGQKEDYGITQFDFSEYAPQDFSKIGSSTDILLDFLKSWENPTVWKYQEDIIGYSSYVAKYITQDKTKYICFDDGLSTRNFGFGVCHYYSGHFNNQQVYADEGVDITQYFDIGCTLDVEIVDRVKLKIVENNRNYIESKLTEAGISLEENQLRALDAISYQWGPYGTIQDFISAYKQYGDTDELRTNFKHNGDYPFLSGDNARDYEIKRANANWTLFHEGRYLTSDGGELDPNNYFAGGEFLEVARNVWVKVCTSGNYTKYGGASIPCAGPTIDCSSFVSWVLYEYGYTEFAGGQKNTETFYKTNWNQKYGWEEIPVGSGENPYDILQPGDLFVRWAAGGTHHITLVAEKKDGRLYSYDCGNTSANWNGTDGSPADKTYFLTTSGPGKIIRVTSP